MNLNTIFSSRTFNKVETCTITAKPEIKTSNLPAVSAMNKSNLKFHKNENYEINTMGLLGFGQVYNPYLTDDDDEDDTTDMKEYSDILDHENEVLLFGTYEKGCNYQDRYGNIYYITEITNSEVKYMLNPNIGKLRNSIIKLTRTQFLEKMQWKTGELTEYFA